MSGVPLVPLPVGPASTVSFVVAPQSDLSQIRDNPWDKRPGDFLLFGECFVLSDAGFFLEIER
jgi:hypothetical protein